jgi:hypothetical protein
MVDWNGSEDWKWKKRKNLFSFAGRARGGDSKSISRFFEGVRASEREGD